MGRLMRPLNLFLLGLIAVVTAAVFLTPVIVKSQLEARLSTLLKADLAIGQLDLNVFRGTARIVSATIGDSTRIGELEVDIAVLPLLDNVVQIEALAINDIRLPFSVARGGIAFDDFSLPETSADPAPAETGTPWTVLLALGSIDSTQIPLTVNGVAFDIVVASLEVAGFDSSFPAPFQVQAALSVNDAPIEFDATIEISDALTGVSGRVSVDGFDLDPVAQLAGMEFGGMATLDASNLNIALGDTSRTISGTFDAALDDVNLRDIVVASMTRFSYEGRLDASIEGDETMVRTDGRLDVDTLAVTRGEDADVPLPGPVSVGSIGWTGVSALRLPAEAPLTATVGGDIAIDGVSADPFGNLAGISVQALNASLDRVAAERIGIRGLDVVLTRLEDGSWAGLPAVAESDSDVAESASATSTAEEAQPLPTGGETTPAEAEPALPVSIDVASLTLGEGSHFRFIDRTVTPMVELEFREVEVEANNISTTGPMTYSVSMRHPEENDTAAIRSSGTVSPFERPVYGDLTLQISRFDMHELSPYVGGGIRSGLLQLMADVEIDANVLNANNNITIVGMRVDDSVAEGGGSDMPISTALSLLKDKNNRVELEVPMTVSVDQFQIDTSDIIRTAVTKAARSAAFTYAKFALQPFGSLLLLKDLADAAAAPQFAPIEFEPGSTELSNDGRRYAGKLRGLLLDRPALAVTICGYSTNVDRQAMAEAAEAADESAGAEVAPAGGTESLDAAPDAPAPDDIPTPAELRALAEERGRVIRAEVASPDLGETQLLSCAPTYLDDDSEPRVAIKL